MRWETQWTVRLGCGIFLVTGCLGLLAIMLVHLLRPRGDPAASQLETLAFAVGFVALGLIVERTNVGITRALLEAEESDPAVLKDPQWQADAKRRRWTLIGLTIVGGVVVVIVVAGEWWLGTDAPYNDGPVYLVGMLLGFGVGGVAESARIRARERERGVIYYYDARRKQMVAVRASPDIGPDGPGIQEENPGPGS